MSKVMENEVKLGYTITSRVVEISNHRLNGFHKMMKSIGRYTRFLGLPEPKMTELGKKTYYAISRPNLASISLSEEYKIDLSTITDDYPKAKANANANDIIYSEEVNVFNIEVVDEIIPENEWSILGVIDHVDGIIISAPSKNVPFELIPSDMENSCDCDHCNTKRRRNKTIFVENEETNEVKRVGGSCIKYYLGYDYEKVLSFITALNLFNTFGYGEENWRDESCGDFGGRYLDYTDANVDVADAIKYFFWYVNNRGYMSKAAAQRYNESVEYPHNTKESTSESLASFIDYINTPPYSRDADDIESHNNACNEYSEVTETYTNEYYEIINQFVEERYMENNFLVNTRQFLVNGGVKVRNVKYIFSACSMYHGMKLAEERKKNKNKEVANSKHVGTVGEKSNLPNLTITGISGYEGGFGWVEIYRLKDDNGNLFTKFGKLNVKHINKDSEVTDLSVGAVLSFTADIKKHDDYKGVKQTILGRTSKLK